MSSPTPFYSVPGPEATRGRFLLLSWHFPPGQTAGALRWQKMAQFVWESGYGLDVVTIAPEVLDAHDDERLKELPPGTRVYGVTPELGLLQRVDAWRASRWASGATPQANGHGSAKAPRPDDREYEPSTIARIWNVLLADSQDEAWSRAARALACEVLDASHRAVISCGPPHTIHVQAMAMADQAGLLGVMDLRDPWSTRVRAPISLDTPLHFAIADIKERRAARHARLIVANTDALAAALRRAHPSARVVTVMNGYDEEPLPDVPRSDRFTLAYAGAIYLDRDPRPLFQAVANAAQQLGVGGERLGLELVGHVHDFGGRSVQQMVAEAGASEFVRLSPPVRRTEVLGFLAQAPMLVSLPQDSAYAIPSKVFEYMRFPAWLLAMAGPESPTTALLSGTAADVVDPNDVDGLARAIVTRAKEWWSGVQPPCIADDSRFSRRHQAGVLLAAVNDALTARA